MSDDNCLDASNPSGPVKLVRCHGMGGNQMWTYTQQVLSGGFALKLMRLQPQALGIHGGLPMIERKLKKYSK